MYVFASNSMFPSYLNMVHGKLHIYCPQTENDCYDIDVLEAGIALNQMPDVNVMVGTKTLNTKNGMWALIDLDTFNQMFESLVTAYKDSFKGKISFDLLIEDIQMNVKYRKYWFRTLLNWLCLDYQPALDIFLVHTDNAIKHRNCKHYLRKMIKCYQMDTPPTYEQDNLNYIKTE